MADVRELLARASEDQPALSITPDGALRAGRRARTRRQMLTAGLGLAVLGGTGVAATVLRGAGPVRPTLPDPTGVPRRYPVPQLPPAPGLPGAAERPDLLGTDPLLRHFTVESSAWPVGDARYSAAPGTETVYAGFSATVSRDQAVARAAVEDAHVGVYPAASLSPGAGRTADTGPAPMATSRTTIDLDGRPATLVSFTPPDGRYPFWGLVWQPVDGLWVGLLTQTEAGEDDLWHDVSALRLTSAYRCVVPFTVSDAPPGARIRSCSAGLPSPGDRPYAQSSVVLDDADGNTAEISVGAVTRPSGNPAVAAGPGPLPAPNRTVAGRPIWWSGSPGRMFIADDFDGIPLAVTVTGAWDEPEATRIVAGLRIADNLTDPARWPTKPLTTAG